MDIIEAKRLFMLENASLCNLERDGFYDEFMQLNISEDTLKKWKEELIENYKKIVFSVASSNHSKINTIFEIGDVNSEKDENRQFILDWYKRSYKDMDDFSRMLLCEVLSGADYKKFLSEKGVDLKKEVDYLVEMVQKDSFSIDTSYKNALHFLDGVFDVNNILVRLTELKDRLNEKPQQKKVRLRERLFKKKT